MDTIENPQQNSNTSRESSRSSLSATGDSHPPPTPLVKNKNYAGPPIPLKEKRHSSSIFNVSQDRHLVPLPNVKGVFSLNISIRVDLKIEFCFFNSFLNYTDLGMNSS